MDTDVLISGLQQVALVAAITEPIVEGIKLARLPKELTPAQKQAVSFATATLVAVGTGTTLFEGNLASTIIGTVVAGFIAGRGSNIAHSLIGIIKGTADTMKVKTIK